MNRWRLYSEFWHGYLRYAPYDGAMTWSPEPKWGHVFRSEDAKMVLFHLPLHWIIRPVPALENAMPLPENAQLVPEPVA